MLPIPFFVRGTSGLLNSNYPVRIFLLLSAVFLSCGANDGWDLIYEQQRIYYRDPEHNRWKINLSTDIAYPVPAFRNSFPSESLSCIPIGNYNNNSVAYAVCNKDPSYAKFETFVPTMITNNVTSLSMNFLKLSGKERSHSGFQCMRFYIRAMDQERNIRVSNLTPMPCPGLSFASLFYPHQYLNFAQIFGLPLQQDPSNGTHACPKSSNLEALNLHSNGITSTPFSSCPAYLKNIKYVLLENQQLILDDKPLFTKSNHLIYLSLHDCSLQNVPRSIFVGLSYLKMLNISNNNISSFQIETFHDLISLTVLRIDNNVLTTLHMSVFQRLSSLQYLYLSVNRLSSLDGEVAILPSLRFIDLSYNKLTMVRTELFWDSPMLTIIILNSNSIRNIESGAFMNMSSFRALVDLKINYSM